MLNPNEIMEYELKSNPIVGLVSSGFLQDLLGRYYAWKVRRKYGNYARVKAMEAQV